MKQKGLFVKPVVKNDKNTPFFYRLVKSESYDGAVSVEAVDEFGERISLLCRISTQAGVEMYSSVDTKLGFKLDDEEAIIVADEATV